MNDQEAEILWKKALGRSGDDVKNNLLITMIDSDYTFGYSYIVCSLFIGAQLGWGLKKCMDVADRMIPLLKKFVVHQER